MNVGEISVETACVENGITIDESDLFSPSSRETFNIRNSDYTNFHLFPEFQSGSTRLGTLEESFTLRTRKIGDQEIEIWYEFTGRGPGYCAHIISSPSSVLSLASIQGERGLSPGKDHTDDAILATIAEHIKDCRRRILQNSESIYPPRDCYISVEIGGVVAGDGCQCFGPEVAVPARAARILLTTKHFSYVVDFSGQEVLIEEQGGT